MDLRRDRKHSLKFREMLETQRYEQDQDACRREETKISPVKKKIHIFNMCAINVRSLVNSIHSRRWSRPPCPNLIGSVNLNQLVIQRQGGRVKLKLRQLNAKLSQPRKQTQGERELPRPELLNSKLSQPRKQTQGERELSRPMQLNGKLSQPRKQTQGQREFCQGPGG